MSPQTIKTQLLAVGLFAASACGTLALFGCVPLLAQMTSSHSKFSSMLPDSDRLQADLKVEEPQTEPFDKLALSFRASDRIRSSHPTASLEPHLPR
jgi:hypothetical protein